MTISGGTFTRTDGTNSGPSVCVQQKAASTKPSAVLFDNMHNDIAVALNLAFYRDGQATATGNWNMGNNNISNISTIAATTANVSGVLTGDTLVSGEAAFSAGATVADTPVDATDVVRFEDIGSVAVGAPGYICVQTTADSAAWDDNYMNPFDEDNYTTYSHDVITAGEEISYSTSTGRFTCAKAGVYLVNAALCFYREHIDELSSDDLSAHIRVNGTIQQSTGSVGSCQLGSIYSVSLAEYGQIVVNGVHILTAGQYIDVQLRNVSTTVNSKLKSGSSISIVRLR